MAHQNRLSRTLLLSASVGLLAGLSSPSAQATLCKADADCASGAMCIGAMTARGGSPAIGIATPVPIGGATGIGSGAVAGTVVVSTGGMGGSLAGDADKPTPDPMPVPATPNATGYCQVPATACKSNAECPADSTCRKSLVSTPCSVGIGGNAGSAGSVPEGPTPPANGGNSSSSGGSTGSAGAGATSGSADTPVAAPDYKCDATPVESDTGYCEPAPRTCKVVSDCPAPLTCGATTCTGGECPSVCAFNATVCKADTDCTAANYECATVSKSSWCSGGAAVACDKDGTCSTVATTAPDCGTTEIKQCMPKLIDCSAGQTCPAGWSCYDSSDHAMSAPSWWNVTDVIKACMPDGITMVVDGHALGISSLYFAGGGYGISGGAKGGGTSNGSLATGVPSTDSQGSGGSAGTRAPETAPSTPSTVNNNGSTPAAASGSDTSTSTGTATATDSVGSKSDAGGGCSFGGSHTGAWGLLLTGLAFVLSMRRRRR